MEFSAISLDKINVALSILQFHWKYDKLTDRQTDRQTHRHTDTQTHRHTHTHTHKHTASRTMTSNLLAWGRRQWRSLSIIIWPSLAREALCPRQARRAWLPCSAQSARLIRRRAGESSRWTWAPA